MRVATAFGFSSVHQLGMQGRNRHIRAHRSCGRRRLFLVTLGVISLRRDAHRVTRRFSGSGIVAEWFRFESIVEVLDMKRVGDRRSIDPDLKRFRPQITSNFRHLIATPHHGVYRSELELFLSLAASRSPRVAMWRGVVGRSPAESFMVLNAARRARA